MLGNTATMSINTIATMTRRSTMRSLRNGVVPARMQRVAAENAFHAEPASLERPGALDRLGGVVRAGGREARLRQHEMRQSELVCADQSDRDQPRPASWGHRMRLTAGVDSVRRTS